MAEPAAKLRQLRISRGFRTAKDAADYFGWVYNTYKSHENDQRPISKKAAEKYAKAYGVLAGWLLFNGEPKSSGKRTSTEVFKGILQSVSNISAKQIEDDFTLAYRMIPRLNWEIMSSITDIQQAIAESKEFFPVSANDSLPSISFSLTVSDDSMMAIDTISNTSFRQEDEIIMSPEGLPRPGSFVLARIFARNEAVFRQYRENGHDKQGRKIITLHALNPNWADEDIVLGFTGDIIARLIRHSRDYS